MGRSPKTEGASGGCSSGLMKGRYLLAVIDTRNFFHWVLSSNRPVLPAGGLTFLLRQESKQRSRLKGGTTRSRSNCSPLENPPGGTIGRLTLRFGSGAGFRPLHPFRFVWVWDCFLPTLSIGRWKKTGILSLVTKKVPQDSPAELFKGLTDRSR